MNLNFKLFYRPYTFIFLKQNKIKKRMNFKDISLEKQGFVLHLYI